MHTCVHACVNAVTLLQGAWPGLGGKGKKREKKRNVSGKEKKRGKKCMVQENKRKERKRKCFRAWEGVDPAV